MRAFIDAAFFRARTVISTLVLLLVSGAVTYVGIPKEAEPDVNIPMIIVDIKYEGISPEDAESMLLRPMELKLRDVEGLKEMRARGFLGGASVILEFEAGFDSDAAMADVREQVDLAKGDLPDGTDDPTVKEINISLFPVLVVTLSGDVPERTLLKLARDMQDAIEGVGSVLKAEMAGERDEMIEIVIDPVKVESYGLSPDMAVALVKSSNLLVAAGQQDTGLGRFSLKVPGLLDSLQEIKDLPVRTNEDAVVRLGDIAEVRRSFKDAKTFARVGGNPALALEVSKRIGANIIDTIAKVKQTVAEERATWPLPLQQAVGVAFTSDRSEDIQTRLNDLQNNVISAVLLVMIVVVAALGARSAGLVGVAIPGSFLTGILVLGVIGFTFNIVVLFGLILAVGMLVDGAIVVTEYADRKMAEGQHRKLAYALAAKRMAWPIIASTATTLAVFMPLMFWPGLVGEFMKYLPITLVAVLAASLLMALIFVPTLGAYYGKPGAADAESMKALAVGEEGDLADLRGYTGKYVSFLSEVVEHPGKVLLAAVSMLVAVQVVYQTFGKGVEFFPQVEPANAQIQVRARGNLSIHEQNAFMRTVEGRILDMAEIETVYTRTGSLGQSNAPADTIGIIFLEFTDWDQRRPAEEILQDVLARTQDIAGIVVDYQKQEMGPPTGKALQVQLSSRYPELLDAQAARVVGHLRTMDDLIAIEDPRPLPGIDWEFEVDRAQASKFGVSLSQIGKAIRMASTGIKLGDYRPQDNDEEIDIRARYPADYRTLEQLDHIRISTNQGLVPLSNFLERVARPKVTTLSRVDSRRVMTVKADVPEGVLADDKVREVKAWLATANLDPRIDVAFKGEDEEQKKAQAFLSKAFGVALFVMAIILVTQFNSFYSAFLILTAVIMSTIGVFIGLLITGRPFGIVMSGIGVIALAGIVVNNNIVLIDTFDRLKGTTATVKEAILRTGAQRLRPVLLTTVTTMLGLLPMVFGIGIDFVNRSVSMGAPSMQMWTQLSTAIVFGIGFATVLTLVVTPNLLMLREKARQRKEAWKEKRKEGRGQSSSSQSSSQASS